MAPGAGTQQNEPRLSPGDLTRLGRFIESHCGIQLPADKHVMLEGRLRKRLRAQGVKEFGEYCRRVMAGDEAELGALVDLVSTNETAFFREPRHFDYLRQSVVPELGAQLLPAGLRVWSAACSTGEEPWTLAMVMAEVAVRTPGFRFQILASDICSEALATARTGVYSTVRVEPIPIPLRKKYLRRRKDGSPLVRIDPSLRGLVRFARVNLLDRDLDRCGPVEVIFCRNVFIYFERRLQREILLRFARTLVKGGYVFLGHAESINGLDVPFTQVAPTVYRKEGR